MTQPQLECPEGLAYEDFQIEDIHQMLQWKDTLNANPPGLGKTIEAIGVANNMPDCGSILVICKASLKAHWYNEFEKWATWDWSKDIAERGYCPDTDIVIINYDIVHRHLDYIHSRHWNLLIIDESHYLKNAKAQRTKRIWGGKIKRKKFKRIEADRTLALTGTPITSRPIDLWTTCKAFDPDGLGADWYTFVRRYCAAYSGRYGLDTSGASHLGELRDKLYDRFMVRHNKSILGLKPKIRQIIAMRDKRIEKALLEERTVVQNSLALLKGMLGIEDEEELLKLDDDAMALLQGSYGEDVVNLKKPATIPFTEIARVRHITALAKVPLVVDFVKGVLEREDKVIVFAHHHDVIEGIAEKFKDPLIITGKTPVKKRQPIVDQFQEDPKRRIIIGNGAMGEGYTMTAAKTVVLAELSWIMKDIEQNEDRAWRYGQENSVMVYHLVADGSIDARMAEVLVQNQAVIEKVMER